MPKYEAVLLLKPKDSDETFSTHAWDLADDTDLIDFQEAVSAGLVALGRKRIAVAAKS